METLISGKDNLVEMSKDCRRENLSSTEKTEETNYLLELWKNLDDFDEKSSKSQRQKKRRLILSNYRKLQDSVRSEIDFEKDYNNTPPLVKAFVRLFSDRESQKNYLYWSIFSKKNR